MLRFQGGVYLEEILSALFHKVVHIKLTRFFFFKERPKVYLSFNMFCAFCTYTKYEWSRHWLNPSKILSCLGSRDHIKAQKLCKVNIALNSQRNLFIIITHIVYFNMLQISCKVTVEISTFSNSNLIFSLACLRLLSDYFIFKSCFASG